MAKKIKTVGVIPARYGSTRLPGKSLVMLCGKPLIHWVVKNALKAKKLDRVILATDDRRIADAVKELDVEAVMTRPDHPSGTDRIAEAVQKTDYDVVVNIQGDEPLIDPGLIDKLAGMIAEGQWDMATACSPFKDGEDINKPSYVKVTCDAGGKALYFSRSVIPYIRDNDVSPDDLYRRHIGIYSYRRSFLDKLVKTPQCALEKAEKLEQLRALYIGGRIAVIDAKESGIGVDTPEDIAIVEKELAKRIR